MNREQKTAVVDEIAGQIEAADAIFAVDYRGITVAQVAALRAKLSEADAKLRVVKNSLSERAADQAGAAALKPMLEGPTALALVHGDAALAAKALNDAARALNILEFKGGLMNGSTLSADDVRSIARLPSRDALNAQLVATIAAPLSGLVRGLNALIAGVAIQLQAIADQGLVSGSGAESAPEAVAPPEPLEVAAQPPAGSEAETAPEAEPAPEPESPLESESTGDAAAAEATQPEPAAGAEPEPAALAEASEPPAESETAPVAEAPTTESEKPDQDAAADAEQSDA